MGVCWLWVSEERGQYLDPNTLGENSKTPTGPKTVQALAHAMMYGDWRLCSVRAVDDESQDEFFFQIRDELKDVSQSLWETSVIMRTGCKPEDES